MIFVRACAFCGRLYISSSIRKPLPTNCPRCNHATIKMLPVDSDVAKECGETFHTFDLTDLSNEDVDLESLIKMSGSPSQLVGWLNGIE